MSPIEKLLVQHLESGLPPSLAALGGEEAILNDAVVLARSPLFDELLTVLCHEWSQLTKLPDIESFILSGFHSSEPITLAHSLDVLFEARAVLERIATSLSGVLVARIRIRRTELEALIAAKALEGLFRLVLEKLTTKYALLDALTSVQSSEIELFANHAARIIGIAYDQWKEDELLAALQRIAAIPESSSEANFSLGLAMLSQAFAQENQNAIYAQLEIALGYFRSAAQNAEERDDAIAYGAAIEVLLCFNQPNQRAAAQRAFERLQRAVAIRQLWLHNSYLPNWLSHLVTSEVEWTRLASLLQEATGNLAKPGWLRAVEVLQQLFEVYRISRSICLNINTTGLELLLQPHIEASFLHSQARLSMLDDWLYANQASSEWHEVAKLLRERIKLLAENSSSMSNPEGGRFPRLAATLGTDPLAGIKEEQLEQIEDVLRVSELSRESNISITAEHIFRNITQQLASCSDYTGEAKDTFDVLLLRTINFLISRSNLGREHAASGQMYLFRWDSTDGAPHEKELQHDYWNYLVSSYGSSVHTEMSDIASGRVDIIIFYPRHRFVAEMKRELTNAQPDKLKRFLGQTTIYQTTDVRLGMLLVLDLTDKTNGIPHVERNIWVETHQIGSFADTRYVVVFRVPGNRINPSSTRS